MRRAAQDFSGTTPCFRSGAKRWAGQRNMHTHVNTNLGVASGGGRWAWGEGGAGEGREEERSSSYLTVSAYLIRSRVNRVRAWRVARVLGRGRGGPACTCRSKEVAWRPEAGEWEEERRVKRYGWWRFYLDLRMG